MLTVSHKEKNCNIIFYASHSYTITVNYVRFGLVSLFKGTSTFVDYLIPKLSLLKNNSDIIYVKRLWCNGYHCRKRTRLYEFKSWTRPIAFHNALKTLKRYDIQLFSFQYIVGQTELFQLGMKACLVLYSVYVEGLGKYIL